MNPGTATRTSKPDCLLKLLNTEFKDAHQANDLFNEFLQYEAYNESFCLRLLAVARQGDVASWDIRRLAVLMLEHQILKLPLDKIDAFDFLLVQLNLKPITGVNIAIVNSVLKEGYSTTDLRRFIPEFRCKLERLNRVHDKIKGRRSSEIALRDFIELSRRDCKLSLSRYVFQPEDVVDQILKQVKVSEGVEDLDIEQPPFVEKEIRRAINFLPDFEARILKKLCETSKIYWVSEATRSEINSLVEYPLTTVVLVIKLPGSDIEFEIKRAGRRGPHPLGVVYARNGYTVPPTHRLDGGNMRWLLRYEANVAFKLAIIYRQVHKAEAPISSHVSRSNIFYVPVRNTEEQLFSYFTESTIFGSGFRKMRVAMEESVEAFKVEDEVRLTGPRNGLGLTRRFISFVAPAQSILTGTSSLRLDKLATYLSITGPKIYFQDGLNVAYSKDDARRLADEIMEEILGVYQSPDIRYQSYKQYLEAAFSATQNRVRANQVYLSLMRQIGKFWGTLLAVGGYTRGESFVARNVGLKSFWNNGQWKVKIIFMDHDALVLSNRQDKIFYASSALPNMALDETYIWGRSTPQGFARSEVGYLQNIYRISDDLSAKGQALAHKALKVAYRKTLDGLLINPELRRLFNKTYIERLNDWDTFVRGHFRTLRDSSARATWKREMTKVMAAKGYRQHAFDSYMEVIEKNKGFLERYSFLFGVERRGVLSKGKPLKAQ
jgi:hypothetical protein